MLQVIIKNYLSKQKILVFMQIITLSTSHNKCPTENSSLSDTGINVQWVSNNVANQVVISKPPCFDKENKLITRICIDGFWDPASPPLCEKNSTNFDICPKKFERIDDYCFVVTEPRNWFKTFSSGARVYKSTGQSFWLPVRRMVKFGPFENVEIGHDYGSTMPVDTRNYRKYYSGDCLFFDAVIQKIRVENCTNQNHFSKNLRLYDCPLGCRATNSYYKAQNCEKLATIETINDKKILEDVAGDKVCRIGELTPNTLSSKGLRPYLNDTLLQYGSIITNCSICTEKPEFVKTNLVLSFEEKNKKLYLLVYSPEGVKRIDHKYLIFCFTNAAQSNLKEKLQLVRRFSSESFPDSLLVFEVKIEEYMGEYWCEAFSPVLLLRSDRVIAYKRKRGNEYSLRLVVNDVCKLFACNLNDFFKSLRKRIFKKVFDEFSTEIRLMEVFNFDTYKDVLDILIHVSTGKNYDIITEYKLFLSKLETLDMEVVFFRSSEFCLPEKIWLHDVQLTWPLSTINSAVLPNEFCLMKDGTPVIRQCEGTFLYGTVWSNVTGSCVKNPRISKITEKLKEISTLLDISSQDVLDNIKDANLTIFDIYYLNIILKRIKENFEALDLVNKLMVTNENILKMSQNLLNLNDMILERIDDILANASSNPQSAFCIQKDNLIVHISNPFQSNVSGLLLYGPESSSFSENSVLDFTRRDSFENIEKHNLKLAVYVPETVLEQILNETETNNSDIFIITVVFYNDHLFIDDNYHSGSFVVSVSIPGFGSYLKNPIPIVFESRNHTNTESCGFWNNGKKQNWKKGKWSLLGSNHVQKFQDLDLHECSFVHLTHFALLIMSDKKNIVNENFTFSEEVFEDNDEYVLEILTIIGCTFSIIGIFGIFTTAVLFERWRNRSGTKILLNLTLAILFEIICIHLSGIKIFKTSNQGCKIIGMVLHYVVLSKFSWMLVYALLQYYRFVKVISVVPKNLILKSVLIGWAVPLAVVFLVGLITSESYASSSYELCYPRGWLLYLSVLMPICTIMLANLAIFCLVMYNVTKSGSLTNKKMFRLRLCLALLLFSVSGIPWIFGILAEFLLPPIKIILFFIFCITATLQGFVLFVFYVILNRETREFWIRYMKTYN